MRLPRYELLKITAQDIGTLKAEWMGEVVTCGECEYLLHCNFGISEHGLDNYCSLGRRKESDNGKEI